MPSLGSVSCSGMRRGGSSSGTIFPSLTVMSAGLGVGRCQGVDIGSAVIGAADGTLVDSDAGSFA